MKNIILDTDSYKLSHYKQYDPTITALSSYIESRGVTNTFPKTSKHIYFGLQAWIKENLSNTYIRSSFIKEAKEFAELHGEPFNTDGWNDINSRGTLPIEIQAIDEGSIVPTRTPLVQVISTDSSLSWIESFIETSLLRGIWYPSTVATLSYLMKERIGTYWIETVDSENMPGLDFALHDFGARGVSSYESAGLGGMAHLLNFKGSDTITGILFAKKYYNENMAGYSVPAAEHSTMQSWGPNREYDAIINMIKSYGAPGKIYSVVGDTYDIYNFVDLIISDALVKLIKLKGGRFVIRPDSGDPAEVLSKILKKFEIKGLYYHNKKGFKVLDDSFRILWGDGINYYSVGDILELTTKLGWSAENFVFGMGGALLQKLDRDSLKFAMKLNAIKLGTDEWVPVFKKPSTDLGKASKPGYIPNMPVIWRNGQLLKEVNFSDIRKKYLT